MKCPLDNEVFVCVDCEFTGLDPVNDRVIEVAVALFTTTEILEQFESLIDPECIIPEASIAIHHITDDMVKGKPKIQEVLPTVLKMVGKHIAVGHGISYDLEMLALAAQRSCIPTDVRNNRTIDTLRMARLYGESPVNSLAHLRQHFNIQDEGSHRAMSDVLVNIDVFRSLAKRYKSSHEIFDSLSRPILMKNMPLGKHKGRPFKDIPLEYLRWAAKKEFDQDLLYSIRSELKRRKQGNLFTQSGNPFADL